MIFGLIGGLTLFLYGMNAMSDALQKAALRGECDLAMSSRSLKDYEAELLTTQVIAAPLCRCGDVGVGVEGKSCGVMPQHPGDRLTSTPFWSARVAKVCRRS